MTPKDVSHILDGVQYVHPLEAKLKAMRDELVAAGLVVAYGASDDLLEFEGAFRDEFGAWDGTKVAIGPDGPLRSECDEGADCPYFRAMAKSAPVIEAIWGPKDIVGDPSWLVTTTIPHERFRIMEDDDLFGIGIVFKVEDIGKVAA